MPPAAMSMHTPSAFSSESFDMPIPPTPLELPEMLNLPTMPATEARQPADGDPFLAYTHDRLPSPVSNFENTVERGSRLSEKRERSTHRKKPYTNNKS